MRRLLPILAVNFVGTLGLSIVLPFLVFVVDEWGGDALAYGIISASYSGFQLIGAPLLGRWSDDVGRRRVLLVSHAGTLVSWLVFLGAFALPVHALAEIGGITLTLPLIALFVSRSLDGLTGGNISVANAYLADISSDDDRNANFGKMALSANLGFVVGPALAGLLGGTALGYRLPVIAAIAVSLGALGFIAFGLAESRAPRDPASAARERLGLRAVLRIECLPRLLATHFLVMLAFHFFYAAFPMHVGRGLGWPAQQLGVFFAVLSLSMVVVQGPVLGWASKRFEERALVFFGLATLAVSFWMFGSSRLPLLYAAAGGMALGNGVMWPSLLSLISKAAGPDDQGAVQGTASSGGALASIFGLIAGGALFEQIGTTVFVVSTGIFVVAMGVAASLGASLASLQKRPALEG